MGAHMKTKVSILGTGPLGRAIAERLAASADLDVVLYESVERGTERIDGALVQPTQVLEETSGSDIVVVDSTARVDTAAALESFTKKIERVMACSSTAVLVVADDGSNLGHEAALSVDQIPDRRVIGTGTLPDSIRLGKLIAEALGVPASQVQALALGEPGPSAVPLLRLATVSGVPALELLKSEQAKTVLERFHAPAESGSSSPDSTLPRLVEAQSLAVERIVSALASEATNVVPTAVRLDGEYGIDGVVSVPAVLGPDGVERIVEMDLSLDELLPLHTTAKAGHEARESLSTEE